jgi:PAS domain S-box-containing protein
MGGVPIVTVGEPVITFEDQEPRRLEFERLISDLSSKFINLPPADLDGAIENYLKRVCEFLGFDQSVLWQTSAEDISTFAATHSYDRRGTPHAERMTPGHFPHVREQMLKGRTFSFSSVGELPPEAAVDANHVRLFGIKSDLTIPLWVGGESPVGALAFNTMQAERDWPDPLVKRLELVAQILGNALARRRADEALRASEERLALAADSAEAGLWALDFETTAIWATGRARRVFGYSGDEPMNIELLHASVHPEDWGRVRDSIELSRSGEPADTEFRVLPQDGGVRWVLSRGRPHFDAAGKPDRLTGVCIDITEKRGEQEALRTSEARFAVACQLARLGFYEANYATGFLFMDERCRAMCGLPFGGELTAETTAAFIVEHVHPDDKPRFVEIRERLHDGMIEEATVEYRFVNPVRGPMWMRHTVRVAERDSTGRAVRTLGVLQDTTGAKRVEEELHSLSRRLIAAHEEERASLARELHDDITQRLAVLAIDVGRVEAAENGEHQTEALQAIGETLVRLSDDVHTMAYHLHSSILEEIGLAEALYEECLHRNNTEEGGPEHLLEVGDLPSFIGPDATLCLFRVAQEALNNVSRHAEATLAHVRLYGDKKCVRLEVIDDGVGFNPETPRRRQHLGLASMQERVQLAKGSMQVLSTPGVGTTVIAVVPCDGRCSRE